MHITINKTSFDSMDNSMLGGACFAPIIPMIRAKDMCVKQKVYEQLMPAQKALFMFYAYYNHASHSLYEFYWWSTYYSAQPAAWSAIKRSLQHFEAASMLDTLEQMEALLARQDSPTNPDEFNTLSPSELAGDFLANVQTLYRAFADSSSSTLNRIGECIRSNPSAYIHVMETEI